MLPRCTFHENTRRFTDDGNALIRPGAWLPADHSIHREYLRRVNLHVESNKDEELTPAVAQFKRFIESTPRVYMYFVQMFEEIPRKHPYWRDPTGSRQIRDYNHMLRVLNHIVTRAPEWTDAAEGAGVVGVPMCAIFDYPMATARYEVPLLAD